MAFAARRAMAELLLEQVSKSYDGRTHAVHALDLACAQGQMLALLGPSGCGKSSTLKMVAGIETVSAGTIRFDGRDVTRLSAAQRNIAMVFEDYALYPHLTVAGNIGFPLQIRGTPAAEVARRVGQALDLLGLAALADTPVRSLSGGAQQRVSIGRALVRSPALVMFDEPLSHLDADQKVVLRTEIRRLQSTAGLTSVLVTHDQTEAMAMADRIAVMDHGVLQQVGSPEDLYRRPANRFVAGFIGATPMNFIDAVFDDAGRVRLPGAEGPLLPPPGVQGAPGSAVVVGIRPEDLVLGSAPGLRLGAEVLDHECHGEHDVLRLASAAGTLHADVEAPCPHGPGDGVVCTLPPERLHWFAAADGRALRC